MVGKLPTQQRLRGGMSFLHLHIWFKDKVRCQTDTRWFSYIPKHSFLTIARNILRKSFFPLEPPPAAALGDSSHLLKCQREGEKKDVWHCLPSYLLMWIIQSCNNITAATCCCTEAGTGATAVSRHGGSCWCGARSQEAELHRHNQTPKKDVERLHHLPTQQMTSSRDQTLWSQNISISY